MIISLILTVVFSLYLISLPFVVLIKKDIALKYFSSFASSQKAHLTEQLFRFVFGIAIFDYSDKMLYSNFYYSFGLIIIITTLILTIVPWKWHHEIGKKAIPLTLKYLNLYSFSAFIFGLFILFCVLQPLA